MAQQLVTRILVGSTIALAACFGSAGCVKLDNDPLSVEEQCISTPWLPQCVDIEKARRGAEDGKEAVRQELCKNPDIVCKDEK